MAPSWAQRIRSHVRVLWYNMQHLPKRKARSKALKVRVFPTVMVVQDWNSCWNLWWFSGTYSREICPEMHRDKYELSIEKENNSSGRQADKQSLEGSSVPHLQHQVPWCENRYRCTDRNFLLFTLYWETLKARENFGREPRTFIDRLHNQLVPKRLHIILQLCNFLKYEMSLA